MGATGKGFVGADPAYATGRSMQGVGALRKAGRHGLSAAASIGSIKWVGGNLGRVADLIGISTGAHGKHGHVFAGYPRFNTGRVGLAVGEFGTAGDDVLIASFARYMVGGGYEAGVFVSANGYAGAVAAAATCFFHFDASGLSLGLFVELSGVEGRHGAAFRCAVKRLKVAAAGFLACSQHRNLSVFRLVAAFSAVQIGDGRVWSLTENLLHHSVAWVCACRWSGFSGAFLPGTFRSRFLAHFGTLKKSYPQASQRQVPFRRLASGSVEWRWVVWWEVGFLTKPR